MKKLKIFIFILSFFHIIITGCVKDAERDNPLDPKSDLFNDRGTIRGKVYSYYQPFRPIHYADIIIHPDHHWTTSNEYGDFTLTQLPAGDYTIHVQKEGYRPDSLNMTLKPGDNTYFQFNLNGLPGLVSNKISIGHISRWWPTNDLYTIKIEAEVSDPDGVADIQSVQLSIPDYDILLDLDRTQNPAIFSLMLNEEDLPLSSVHKLLGYPMYIHFHDLPESHCTTDAFYAARVIEDIPTPLSPISLAIVDGRPTLIWQKTRLPFPFTYDINIYRIDQGINTLVGQSAGIPSDSLSYQVPILLSEGTYFWTLTVKDEFGNWSRSKEAAFQVQSF